MSRRAPPPHAGHLDLLPFVRRIYRHRLSDARLKTVEIELLGIDRGPDVDGWEIPGRFLQFLGGGAAGPLAEVVRHNHEDVRSLARLLAHAETRLGAESRPAIGSGRGPGRARPGVRSARPPERGARLPRRGPRAAPEPGTAGRSLDGAPDNPRRRTRRADAGGSARSRGAAGRARPPAPPPGPPRRGARHLARSRARRRTLGGGRLDRGRQDPRAPPAGSGRRARGLRSGRPDRRACPPARPAGCPSSRRTSPGAVDGWPDGSRPGPAIQRAPVGPWPRPDGPVDTGCSPDAIASVAIGGA